MIGLAASSRCEEAFDLHIYPVSLQEDGEWTYHLPAAVVAPRSTGFVTITDRDPAAPLLIDHGYLTDPEGYDLDALIDAIGLMRELAATEPMASLIGPELPPSAGLTDRAALAEMLPTVSKHYYHPTSSCAMGVASDPMAVVDELGAVHGLNGLLINDASIFPIIPRANTNLPVLALAEAMAGPRRPLAPMTTRQAAVHPCRAEVPPRMKNPATVGRGRSLCPPELNVEKREKPIFNESGMQNAFEQW